MRLLAKGRGDERITRMRRSFDAVTKNAAKGMHFEKYGLDVGCDASFVFLQARDPIEAIRLRSPRLKVFRQGMLVAETPAANLALHLDVRPRETN